MLVKVLLFAAAREIAGHSRIDVQLENPSTVGDLRLAIARQFPDLQEIVTRSAIALNQQYATNETNIGENAEIGLIPPVSGG